MTRLAKYHYFSPAAHSRFERTLPLVDTALAPANFSANVAVALRAVACFSLFAPEAHPRFGHYHYFYCVSISGTAVLIIVLSVMSGFDRELRDKIIGFNAHLRITNLHNTMINYEEAARLVSKNPAVKGVAPYVFGQVMMEIPSTSGESIVTSPYVRGIDPKLEGSVSILPRSITNGTFDVRGNRILIGREMARTLYLQPGDPVPFTLCMICGK